MLLKGFRRPGSIDVDVPRAQFVAAATAVFRT